MKSLRKQWKADIDELINTQWSYAIVVATIGGSPDVIVNRDGSTTDERYRPLKSYASPAVGDRVFMLKDKTQWVILGAV